MTGYRLPLRNPSETPPKPLREKTSSNPSDPPSETPPKTWIMVGRKPACRAAKVPVESTDMQEMLQNLFAKYGEKGFCGKFEGSGGR